MQDANNDASTDYPLTLYSPYCSRYILYGPSKENLSKYEDISSLLIVSFILIT